MIFLAVALACEAKPVIEQLQLKQQSGNGSFKVFSNDGIKLIVTGVGGIESVISTTYLLTKFNAKRSDILINFGIAGYYNQNFETRNLAESKNLMGDLFLINSIMNSSSGRNFYPDMVFETSFSEASLLTVDKIWEKAKGRPGDKNIEAENKQAENFIYPEIMRPLLIDMEGAYIYEVSCKFLYSHNIFILKIVSDFGDLSSISPAFIKSLIQKKSAEITGLISNLSKWSEIINFDCPVSEREISILEDISNTLKLTLYQRTEFRKLYEAYLVRNKGENSGSKEDIIIDKIRKLILESENVKEKKEGKILYAKIKEMLSEI